MAGHAYTGMYIKMFVTCWYVGPTIWKTISGNMVRKMYESYLLFCLMMDVLSVPLIVLAAFVAGWQVWVVLAGAGTCVCVHRQTVDVDLRARIRTHSPLPGPATPLRSRFRSVADYYVHESSARDELQDVIAHTPFPHFSLSRLQFSSTSAS